jgi:hypothetical protein
MAPAWALWEAGDKVAAKRVAKKVLAESPSPELAAEAKELLTRLNPPLKAYGYALFAAAVLIGLVLLAALRF